MFMDNSYNNNPPQSSSAVSSHETLVKEELIIDDQWKDDERCSTAASMFMDYSYCSNRSQPSSNVINDEFFVKEELMDDLSEDESSNEKPVETNDGIAYTTCNFCKETFQNMQLLQSHISQCRLNHLIKIEPDLSPTVSFHSTPSISDHALNNTVLNIYTDPKMNNRKRIACEFCGMRYKNPENLQKHMEKTGCAKLEIIDSIQCNACGLSFPGRSNLSRHQKRTGCVQKDEQTSEEGINIEEYPGLKPESLAQRLPHRIYCDTCGLHYKSRSNLVRHQRKTGCKQVNRGSVGDNVIKQMLKLTTETSTVVSKSIVSIPVLNVAEKPRISSQLKSYSATQNALLARNSEEAALSGQNNSDIVPDIRFEMTCDICNRTFENVKRLYNHADTHDAMPAVLKGDLEFLKCKFCLKQFHDHIERRTHEAAHSGEKPYECPHCPQRFVRKRNLMHHIRIHSGMLPFQCELCSQVFRDRRYLTRHIERNHLKVERLACTLCDTKVYDKVQLALHMRTHIDAHIFKCKNCGETKQSTTDKRDQIEDKTQEPESDNSDDRSDQEDYNVPNNPELFCDLCNRYFSEKQAFYHHAESHESIPTALRDDVNFRKCKFCYEEFSTHTERKEHEGTHKRKRSYECPICRKRFICDLSRNLHVRTHSGPVIFDCEKCSKTFKEKSGLKRHIRRKHLKIRKVFCDLCDQRFFDRVALAIHMLTHIKEGNYVCKTCKNCSYANIKC